MALSSSIVALFVGIVISDVFVKFLIECKKKIIALSAFIAVPSQILDCTDGRILWPVFTFSMVSKFLHKNMIQGVKLLKN